MIPVEWGCVIALGLHTVPFVSSRPPQCLIFSVLENDIDIYKLQPACMLMPNNTSSMLVDSK